MKTFEFIPFPDDFFNDLFSSQLLSGGFNIADKNKIIIKKENEKITLR